MNLRRWLTPGIGIKRWLLVVFAGLLLLAVAFAHFLRQVTRDLDPTGLAGALIDLLTLQFLPFRAPRAHRGVGRGRARRRSGRTGSSSVLTDPLRSTDPDQPLVELIYQKRFLARGPRIVAIGGGTGPVDPAARPQGAHQQPDRDRDRGRRRRLVRRAARGARDPAGRRHPQLHRRAGRRRTADERAPPVPLPGPDAGRRDGHGLAGHALGNLLIAAMTAVEGGDFEDGVRLMNRILAVRGQVVPVSPTPLTLHAQLRRRHGRRRPVARSCARRASIASG